MRNNYLGPIKVNDGFNGQIVHLVAITDGPDYSYIIYAVHEAGFYTYAM